MLQAMHSSLKFCSGNTSICCDAAICPKIEAKPIIYSALFPRRVLLLL